MEFITSVPKVKEDSIFMQEALETESKRKKMIQRAEWRKRENITCEK